MRTKQITAACVMLCAGIASAQSNVTLYGVVDVPIEYVTNLAKGPPNVNTQTGIITHQSGGNRLGLGSGGGLSGSQFGFRGSENLGSGYKAFFRLENGFSPDTGTFQQAGRLFGRQGYIGIENAEIGGLTLGRQYSTMFDMFAHASPTNYSTTYEPVFLQLGPNGRSDNAIKYTGNFGQFTTVGHYSFGVGVPNLALTPLSNGGNGEVAGHNRDNTAWGLGMSYNTMGLTVSMAYDQWNAAVTEGKPGAAKKAGAAASYTFGATKIMGGYRWGNGTSHDGVTLLRDNYYWAGIRHQASPQVNLALGLYLEDVKTLRVRSTSPTSDIPKFYQVTFSAAYSLSKRTDLYIITAYSKNAGLNLDSSANGFASSYFVADGKSSQLGTAIGVRHRF